MLVTKTAINVIGEIAKKGYLIIKNQIATLELQQEMVSKMEGLR